MTKTDPSSARPVVSRIPSLAAAAMLAAMASAQQDNHAAVVMGAPTGGAGCGHTNGGTPTTLNNSHAVFELPDCARLRADGSNEVMGIQPDILIGLRSDDGPRRQGIRVAASLKDAIERASRLMKN